MIFKDAWENVLSGQKTQMRRIVKPDEALEVIGTRRDCTDLWAVVRLKVYGFHAIDGLGQVGYFNGHTIRPIYTVGQTYAVQPERGKPAVGRIEILSIRREDVRTISKADALAEGFIDRDHFLDNWCDTHDKPAFRFFDGVGLHLETHNRPAERYQAWVLDFKVVK